MERDITNSLSRFKVSDEHLISDQFVNDELKRIFSEGRAFEFYPDINITQQLKTGEPTESFQDNFIEIKNKIFDKNSDNDQTQMNRLLSDSRLSFRITNAVMFIHRAIAEGDFPSIVDRRIVLVKELPGVPTLFHISKDTSVISHVGQGPDWAEISTIYLGLKIFDAIFAEQKKGYKRLFDAFKLLLMIEERAIETGFSHVVVYPPETSIALNYLVDEVIKNASQFEIDSIIETPDKSKEFKFSETTKNNIFRDLDARVHGDILNFNYEKNLKALNSLERKIRRFKKGSSITPLRDAVKILVAASGHDIHEIRNRANIILERVLAPKEFDAPLATKFINHRIGDKYKFEFKLPEKNHDYFLRIYKNNTKKDLFLEKDIDSEDIPLIQDESSGLYTIEYKFNNYGHYDFLVFKKKLKSSDWINISGTSGRVNVIPDVRGQIILEIFTDIHGHTKSYWRDASGHPGLIYNENGEIIRLGRFSDITVHLNDIKNKYNITAIYLLGAQKRGANWEDWAHEASSPSPFSPMSLVDIEPSLGGDKELKQLVKKAHKLDIKIILDIIPHINRKSDHLSDEHVAMTYNHEGQLISRASTDGKYGSWNDGKLLNYRKFEVWEWLSNSIQTLIEKFDIDGIRFDSAHAVPIMMKKNNYPYVYNRKRTHEEMLEGNIIVNDREDHHYITTGYYDSACRDIISVPLHYYLMLNIEKKLKEKGKKFFIHIAECYWGHERFLTRTGLVPYNSSLFKICENVIHGKTDVREIYHIYDNYFPAVLPEGTELLGILGNHDERRALNTFGHRGLRAAVALTSFMSNMIMDYEGSAEGEGWKVYLDNIYVNWNQFEYASNRSLDEFYKEWYNFHRETRGKGYMVWANNNYVAAALKFVGDDIWIGAFNFADSNQNISIQFDNPSIPIPDETYYKVSDLLYSDVTGQHNYFRGSELKISRINTIVSYTERVKLLKLEKIEKKDYYNELLKDSFSRLCTMSDIDNIESNFSFSEVISNCNEYDKTKTFITEKLAPLFWKNDKDSLKLGLKRSSYFLFKNKILDKEIILEYAKKMSSEKDAVLYEIGKNLIDVNKRGSLIFMSAEVVPFSKSGGLANVVFELPKELAHLKEEVYVITGLYRFGDDKSIKNMNDSIKKYDIQYTGQNVNFRIMDTEYSIGIHKGIVDGVTFFLLDHYEFFDGLYWGFTAEEKLRRRIAFARASAELIIQFNLNPHFTFTNDAFTGIFNGIVQSDPYYTNNENFNKNTFMHIIHNGGWQYFDAYNRYENGFDLFNLFNLPSWRVADFSDPVYYDRLNCMATGIRFADKTITVSPSYAKQIEYAADGLEHLLYNVIGISNAIGQDFRQKINQKFINSGFINENYSKLIEHIHSDNELLNKLEKKYPEIMSGNDAIENISNNTRKEIILRLRNKLMLQMQKGLKVDPDLILCSFIHRISEQKGFQLFLEASEGILKNLGFQVIIGGAISSGDKKGEEIAHGLHLLGQHYSDLIDVSFGFQDVSIPLLASDLFLMPSLHEPGGISQLEAFAAGCLVVARATGGLRDTIDSIKIRGDDVEGNGFLFSDYNSGSFYDSMVRASQFFREYNDETIHRARINAEKSSYFWNTPAKKYIEKIYDLTETIRIIE